MTMNFDVRNRRLVAYCSSSDEDVEVLNKVESSCNFTKTDINYLPSPGDLSNFFAAESVSATEISDDGKVRSFLHLEGNWATHVYIPYECEEDFVHLQERLFMRLQDIAIFKPVEDYHVSLSRTVVIRHHWIDPLLSSLRAPIESYERFYCVLKDIVVYANDERSRSFLALDVDKGGQMMRKFTEIVDRAFKPYNLPPYYKEPRYHLSIGWASGDVESQINHNVLNDLQQICNEFWLHEDPDSNVLDVREVVVKTGNKIFKIPLSTS